MPLLEQGYELGFDEMKLANEDDRNRQAVKWMEQEKAIGTIHVKETIGRSYYRQRILLTF